MTEWETLEHQGESYVKVSPSARARGSVRGADDPMSRMAVYYSPGPGCLTLTLNQAMMKRALERAAVRRKAEAEKQPPPAQEEAWLGKSASARAKAESLALLQALWRDDLGLRLQRASGSNQPILNEWRRRYGTDDPVALHEQAWKTRLVCPAGGRYVWNEECLSYESTAFGCPANPKTPEQRPDPLAGVAAVALGVTFEGDGLRAAAELLRPTPPQP
jgi:hypothetical protein